MRHNTSTTAATLCTFIYLVSCIYIQAIRALPMYHCLLNNNPHSHTSPTWTERKTPQRRNPPAPLAGTSPCLFSTTHALYTLSDKDGRFDERWDVYFHAFLLHETKHCDCYYYKGRAYKESLPPPLINWINKEWWFPENRRNEHTLHMFVAARWAPLEQVFF